MYVFCMSVCFSAAAYLFFLFISFFCKGKNLPFESYTECGFKYFWGVVPGKKWNHDVNCLFLFFFVFLHSTPPACGQSTSPTVNQIPTTLQRIRPRQAHLVCSTDATEVTQKAPPSSFFPPIDNFSLSLASCCLTWLNIWNQMCFRWLVEAELWDIHQISSHELWVQELVYISSAYVYYCTNHHWCWEINSDMMVPGLTLNLSFLFLSLWMHHDTYQSHLTSIAVSRTLEMLID